MSVDTRGPAPAMRAALMSAVLAVCAGAGACKGSNTSAHWAVAATNPPSGDQSEVTPRLPVPQAAEAISDAFAGAAKGIRPSVVRIDVEISGQAARAMASDDDEDQDLPEPFRHFFGGGGRRPSTPVRGTGSGVIIDAAGHVVTNAHVLAHARKVTITLVDGRKFPGKVLGQDPHTDVGVVQLGGHPGTLTIARLGSSDQLRVGQWVLAVGSPLGLDQSVTAGIVSGLGTPRSRVRVSERARGYIQTDAAINPGNSGGPLVNLAGEVVGINTLINVGPGGAYGFAIPVNQVAQVSQTLIKEGKVRYPYLGVSIGNLDDLTDEDRAQLGKVPAKGAVVTAVIPGGPAAEAGLQAGDVITRVGDHAVESAADVVESISGQPIDSKTRVQYQRQGKERSAEVTLRELPGEEPGQPSELGLAMQTLTPALADSLGLDRGTRGAVVADVAEGTPAAKAGLRPGDVIVEIDHKPVTSAEAAGRLLHAGDKKAHLVRVVGAGGARFVTVTAP
jgi:serine protease Do